MSEIAGAFRQDVMYNVRKEINIKGEGGINEGRMFDM